MYVTAKQAKVICSSRANVAVADVRVGGAVAAAVAVAPKYVLLQYKESRRLLDFSKKKKRDGRKKTRYFLFDV